jgi:AraC family transcriptional activator of pobA
MDSGLPLRIKTITEYHKLMGLPKPEHPLISLINLEEIKRLPSEKNFSIVFSFYSISLKRSTAITYRYGQKSNDFDDGILFFMSPNQIMRIEVDDPGSAKAKGWILYVHPDFLYGSLLAKNIKKYDFFGYSVSEALFLSNKEERIIISLFRYIHREYNENIDYFTQDIIIKQLDLLLSYSDRYYHRQFLTRKKNGHKILSALQDVLTEVFNEKKSLKVEVPTVQQISDTLNISTGYLSRLLKTNTGMSTHEHIQNFLIENAKEKLSITDLPVSQIAYCLGFEHPQSFSKFFKKKTTFSPQKFRAGFN